jgi:hypothetical protein
MARWDAAGVGCDMRRLPATCTEARGEGPPVEHREKKRNLFRPTRGRGAGIHKIAFRSRSAASTRGPAQPVGLVARNGRDCCAQERRRSRSTFPQVGVLARTAVGSTHLVVQEAAVPPLVPPVPDAVHDVGQVVLVLLLQPLRVQVRARSTLCRPLLLGLCYQLRLCSPGTGARVAPCSENQQYKGHAPRRSACPRTVQHVTREEHQGNRHTGLWPEGQTPSEA